MRKSKRIYLSELKKLAILWPGDIHMLAEFMLRSYDAKDREINARTRGAIQQSRSTLHGLAGNFAMVTRMPASRIEKEFKSRGFDLGATVEFDPLADETKDA